MIKAGANLIYKTDGDRLNLTLLGEIDHHGAISLRENADELIYKLRPLTVSIDLSKIDFMDSSGLGFIMGRYALQKKLGGSTVLIDPNPRVEKILALAGLERIIKIERTHKK